ncbi:MAG: cyclic nucleotide-binding domain-containing protein [Thaumarchaeota archaeon]|nr:cyclic nucleotide-binding domain-containing protein [Nitrososphaerota archaeon]
MDAKSSIKDEPEVLKLLHNVPIFYDLDDKALKSIVEVGTEATFAPNKMIIQEGGYGDSLHLVLLGKVEVRKGGKLITSLGVGQFFGEMAFLDDLSRKRSADVVAVEETKCLVIPAWSWYNFLRKNPDVAIEVIRSLAHRLRDTSASLAD